MTLSNFWKLALMWKATGGAKFLRFAIFKDTQSNAIYKPNGNLFCTTFTVSASRTLTAADDSNMLECTAGITLTVPSGANALPAGFCCNVIPFGTITVQSDGTSLLNGATTAITRAATSNLLFAIVGRASTPSTYVVTGN